MRVESQAGAFELKFERIEPGEGEIVLTGQMGVWEAKTHMSIDLRFARDVSSAVMFLHNGQIEEQGPPEKLFGNPDSERCREFLSHILDDHGD